MWSLALMFANEQDLGLSCETAAFFMLLQNLQGCVKV